MNSLQVQPYQPMQAYNQGYQQASSNGMNATKEFELGKHFQHSTDEFKDMKDKLLAEYKSYGSIIKECSAMKDASNDDKPVMIEISKVAQLKQKLIGAWLDMITFLQVRNNNKSKSNIACKSKITIQFHCAYNVRNEVNKSSNKQFTSQKLDMILPNESIIGKGIDVTTLQVNNDSNKCSVWILSILQTICNDPFSEAPIGYISAGYQADICVAKKLSANIKGSGDSNDAYSSKFNENKDEHVIRMSFQQAMQSNKSTGIGRVIVTLSKTVGNKGLYFLWDVITLNADPQQYQFPFAALSDLVSSQRNELMESDVNMSIKTTNMVKPGTSIKDMLHNIATLRIGKVAKSSECKDKIDDTEADWTIEAEA